MLISLFAIVYFLPIKFTILIYPFLSILIDNHLFSSVFLVLCFLFVINGANLIDGFNGLLTINLLIINIILSLINLQREILNFQHY